MEIRSIYSQSKINLYNREKELIAGVSGQLQALVENPEVPEMWRDCFHGILCHSGGKEYRLRLLLNPNESMALSNLELKQVAGLKGAAILISGLGEKDPLVSTIKKMILDASKLHAIFTKHVPKVLGNSSTIMSEVVQSMDRELNCFVGRVRLLLEKKEESFSPERSAEQGFISVYNQQWAFTSSDSPQRVLRSSGNSACFTLALTADKFAALAHIDDCTHVSSLVVVIKEFEKQGIVGGQIKTAIFGGRRTASSMKIGEEIELVLENCGVKMVNKSFMYSVSAEPFKPATDYDLYEEIRRPYIQKQVVLEAGKDPELISNISRMECIQDIRSATYVLRLAGAFSVDAPKVNLQRVSETSDIASFSCFQK